MITLEEPGSYIAETTTKGEPPMTEKKKAATSRGTALNMPRNISTEITAVARETGIQKSKVRLWVQDYAVKCVDDKGVRQIVSEKVAPLLATSGSD